jgi:hypothetical protein
VFVLVTCIILHVTKCLEAISIFALVTMDRQKGFDWMLAFLRVVAHQVLKSALASRLVRGGTAESTVSMEPALSRQKVTIMRPHRASEGDGMSRREIVR